MNTCFLSFIVPVYNARTHLRACLDSLLAQDLQPDEFEIVCVNDGSRDDSTAILREYFHRYSNITLVQQGNSGVSTARNAGLCAACGEYVWFVDSDDLVKPNILARLRKLAEGGCDRIIVGGYQFTDEMTEEEWALSESGQLPINTPWYDAVVWRSLLRREFLLEKALSFRYPDISHGEDGLYMYEAVIAQPESLELQEALYFYRVHSGSAETAVSVKNQKKKLHSYIRICEILLDYYENKGQKNAMTANKLMTFLWLSLYSAASLPGADRKEAMNRLKEAGLFPFRRLEECDLRQSYMADISTFPGKAYDKLFLNLHTQWGFTAMTGLQQLLGLKRKVSK